MNRPDALRLTTMFGRNLQRQPTGYRDATALVTFLAYEASWDAASALADALDLDEPTQERIYKKVVEGR